MCSGGVEAEITASTAAVHGGSRLLVGGAGGAKAQTAQEGTRETSEGKRERAAKIAPAALETTLIKPREVNVSILWWMDLLRARHSKRYAARARRLEDCWRWRTRR